MRLWSLHPKYLDRAGLLACWREGLLARACLGGKTKGYVNHSQLARFKSSGDPRGFIDRYLGEILLESEKRGYSFDSSKISPSPSPLKLDVTEGQMRYEWQHLLAKLARRDQTRFDSQKGIDLPDCNEIFSVVSGGIEPWERI